MTTLIMAAVKVEDMLLTNKSLSEEQIDLIKHQFAAVSESIEHVVVAFDKIKVAITSVWLNWIEICATEQLIREGWTPWVARLRVNHLLDQSEINTLARKYTP